MRRCRNFHGDAGGTRAARSHPTTLPCCRHIVTSVCRYTRRGAIFLMTRSAIVLSEAVVLYRRWSRVRSDGDATGGRLIGWTCSSIWNPGHLIRPVQRASGSVRIDDALVSGSGGLRWRAARVVGSPARISGSVCQAGHRRRGIGETCRLHRQAWNGISRGMALVTGPSPTSKCASSSSWATCARRTWSGVRTSPSGSRVRRRFQSTSEQRHRRHPLLHHPRRHSPRGLHLHL